MTWQGRRRASLPANWRKIRARILKRDPVCQLAYAFCAGASVEVDHVGSADDHRDHMLRGVCTPCHKARTQAQALAARQSARRPPRRHPGDA